MIHNKLKTLTILIFILFISCGRNNNKEVQQEKIKTELETYKLDMANTKVIWNGYKTNDKAKVVGYFNEFSTDRENQKFNSKRERKGWFHHDGAGGHTSHFGNLGECFHSRLQRCGGTDAGKTE